MNKQVQIKRRIASLFLAFLLLAIAVAPVLASADPGAQDYVEIPLPERFPRGMLQAEGWR